MDIQASQYLHGTMCILLYIKLTWILYNAKNNGSAVEIVAILCCFVNNDRDKAVHDQDSCDFLEVWFLEFTDSEPATPTAGRCVYQRSTL